MAWQRSHYVAATAAAAAALLWGGRAAWSLRRPLLASPIVVTRAYDEFTVALRRNETMGDLLRRAGVRGRDYSGVLAAATELPVRRLHVGLVFHFRRVKGDSLTRRVSVRPNHEQRIYLERGDAGWTQRVETIPWNITRTRVTGAIASSLYEALDQSVGDSVLPSAERQALAWAIADVYDWEVDFTRDVRPGDRFEVLFEHLRSAEGEERFGRIIAARVDVANRPSYAFYFDAGTEGGGFSGFFDEQGRSLRRAFLRAPLQFRRISSRFGGRFHPILGRWRNHQGTDFAAASGTPVRATADGVATRVGRDQGGYGNLVELRHVNGIRTRYGHLSGFAAGLHAGMRVRQGETIGFVGSTGLSTGPHLHYEFLVNGRATNPQRKDAGAGTPVPKDQRTTYEVERRRLLAQLEPPPAAQQAVPLPLARTPAVSGND
jgi:murein DD-endopeptidase MepM/ murein hydrolase activator NlpD